jgi:hypothetical protein
MNILSFILYVQRTNTDSFSALVNTLSFILSVGTKNQLRNLHMSFPVLGKYTQFHSPYLAKMHSFILCIQWLGLISESEHTDTESFLEVLKGHYSKKQYVYI